MRDVIFCRQLASQPALSLGRLLGRTNQSSSWCPLDVHAAHGAFCEGQQPSKRVDTIERDISMVQEDAWQQKYIQQRSTGTQNRLHTAVDRKVAELILAEGGLAAL